MTKPEITGYRTLTPEELALINEAKALSELCGAFVAKLRAHHDTQRPTALTCIAPPLDQRWVSIGATDLQTGFMAIVRGIAKPTTF